ncbi:MAG: curved DNA-binding protein, partial [Acidimicrobiaceae bacterium]|nr:curved DNA-binding protein [Acidimicrobiaceae bacterium]
MTELESESEPESEATLYERLGVSPGASAEALRAGYRRRARQLHPDVAGDGDTGEAMRSLNQAWAVLSDSGRRRRYDEELAGSASIGPPRSSSSPVDDSGVT